MIRYFSIAALAVSAVASTLIVTSQTAIAQTARAQTVLAQTTKQNQKDASSIPLSTSKILLTPSPGRIASTNSFPATIALSPDDRYAALLNDGYGTQETLATQSIAVLDLKTNQLADFPDKRFWVWFLDRTESISMLRSAQSLTRRAKSPATPVTESPSTAFSMAGLYRSVSSRSNRRRSRQESAWPSLCKKLR